MDGTRPDTNRHTGSPRIIQNFAIGEAGIIYSVCKTGCCNRSGVIISN